MKPVAIALMLCRPRPILSAQAGIAKTSVTNYITTDLVDTFLLPSLVPAIRFLSDYVWIDQKEQKSVIKILQMILLPSSISGEASTMLSSVKNLVAVPLEHALRAYQKEDPKNQDIEPLLKTLKDNLPLSRRTGGAEHNEMESWASSSGNGLCGAVRHTMQNLVQWSMQPGVNVVPTSYTHRQIMAALSLVGPSKMLRMIVEEIGQQAQTGGTSIVYDVAAALICAPNVTNEAPAMGAGALGPNADMPATLQRPWTLREVLKTQAEQCGKIHKKDPEAAEIIVRLYRRIEAQMVVPQPQAILQAPGITLDLNADGTDLGDAMVAAAGGVAGDGMSVSGVGLDIDMGDMSDLGLGGPSGAGGLDGTGDADLFGGLDTSMDVFDGWDTMDMT